MPNLVEKLNLLRQFVGIEEKTPNGAHGIAKSQQKQQQSAQWTESDLTICLKQCGYNVELAAEALLTNQYKRPNTVNEKRQAASLMLSSKMRSSDQSQDSLRSNRPSFVSPTSTASRPKISAVSSADNFSAKSRKRLPRVSYSSDSVIDVDDSSISNEVTNIKSSKAFVNEKVSKKAAGTNIVSRNEASYNLGDRKSLHVHNLLLCNRWISDCFCTTKNCSLDYQEHLTLEHSSTGYPSIRFSGRRCEGKLPEPVASIITPILRFQQEQNIDILQLKATALMEQKCMNIGTDVPISLSIILVNPIRFFQLFHIENDGGQNGTKGSAMQYFENKKASNFNRSGNESKRSKNMLPLSQAAFLLLQWAHYGSDFSDFRSSMVSTLEPEDKKSTKEVTVPGKNNAKCSTDQSNMLNESMVDDDDDDGIEMNENDFEEASVAESTSEAQQLLEKASESGPDRNMMLPQSDDPVGFSAGVTLRPYQKQALFFMLRREQKINDDSSREDLDEQLQLLAELASAGNQKKEIHHETNSLHFPGNKKQPNISCDCSPIVVSAEGQEESRTILDDKVNPLSHPLWQKRYLASRDLQHSYIFFVNEVLKMATLESPLPPEPCSGGILGDAMGLGKTVMIMALILQSKYNCGQQEQESLSSAVKRRGDHHDSDDIMVEKPTTTLIIAKLSLLQQWEEEIKTKTNLSCLVYYGNSSSAASSLANYDVVVTTYGTIQGEANRKNPVLRKHQWLRVVLDEAHCIRNHRTVASKVCCQLNAIHRWCVSGTIIQNSLEDVYGMMKFLKHEPWNIPSFWKAAISQPIITTDKNLDDSKLQSMQISMNRIRRLLSPIMLRRTKDSLTKDGKPLLSLPPIEAKVISIEFTDTEREFYNALLSRSLAIFDGYLKNGTASKAYIQIFALLQRLRQACDHISLSVKTHKGALNNAEDPNVGDKESNHQTNNSPIVRKDSDGAIDNNFLSELLTKFCSNQDTSASSKKRHLEGSDDESSNRTSCRKRNAEQQLPSYVSNAADILSQAAETGCLKDECAICLDKSKIEDAVTTSCAHTFCFKCLVGVFRDAASNTASNSNDKTPEKSGFFKSSHVPDGDCPVCMSKVISDRLIVYHRDENNQLTTAFLSEKKKSSRKVIIENKHDKEIPKEKVKSAKEMFDKAIRGLESSKTMAIINELDAVWKQDPGSKVLIFSHYLGFLDLLEAQLKRCKVTSFRLDGSLSLKERMNVLDQFKSFECNSHDDDQNAADHVNDTTKNGAVLLMSMSAGSEGLNITCASSCFIAEPWWNSAKEDQCIHRIHRIGQLASVVRSRKFIVRDSVEERIVELQQRKSYVAGEIYASNNDDLNDDNDAIGSSKLSIDDLRSIFGKR